jgi:hypothetical protein
MGLLAAVCGLALAEVLSAEFGAQSSGPPAALKTVTTPASDLGKLRQTAARSRSAENARKRHKRVNRVRRHPSAPPAPPAPARTVAQVQPPASTPRPVQTPSYQQTSQPVRRLSAPSRPAPVRTAPKRTAPRPKPQPLGGSFDDSG